LVAQIVPYDLAEVEGSYITRNGKKSLYNEYNLYFTSFMVVFKVRQQATSLNTDSASSKQKLFRGASVQSLNLGNGAERITIGPHHTLNRSFLLKKTYFLTL
jgi:hypothetical protein